MSATVLLFYLPKVKDLVNIIIFSTKKHANKKIYLQSDGHQQRERGSKPNGRGDDRGAHPHLPRLLHALLCLHTQGSKGVMRIRRNY